MKSLMSYINNSYINESNTPKERQQKIKELTILDQMANGEGVSEDTFIDIFKPNGPCIYAFVTDKVKDSIKIGFTDQHPEKRVDQWRKEYGKNEGEVTLLGYWSSEEFMKAGEKIEKVFFWDHEVHKKVREKRYKNLSKEEFYKDFLTDIGKEANAVKELHYSSEFFTKYKYLLNGELDAEDKEELSEELIKDIIIQMHEAIKNGDPGFKVYKFSEDGKLSSQEADEIWKAPDTYKNTDLQNEAIANALKALKEGKKNLLMAAVMRFGKTHACYEIVNQSPDLNRIIVVSAKADVRDAWRSDINHVHFYKNFAFVEVDSEHNIRITMYDEPSGVLKTKHERRFNIGRSIGESLEDEFEGLKDKKVILFCTLHDLGGSLNKIKKKHIGIFDDDFDMMIVDETHYGSHANTFGKITKLDYDDDEFGDVKQEIKEYETDRKKIDSININYRHVLQVSGTPYYILASNEMIKDDAEVISKVSYTDMLEARDSWGNKPENKKKKPEDSPYFGIPTLHRIGLKLTNDCRKIMQENDVSASMTTLFAVNEEGRFVHEKEIHRLVQSIFGDGSSEHISFLKNKKVEGNKVCKHTLVVLPRISACVAMRDLMNGIIDTSNREVISIVGNTKGSENYSIEKLNSHLEDLEKNDKKSIILTVNRFLTGVSMPLVDSMIFMKNANSPQEYDQAIFRLCTRCVKKVENPGKGMPKVINMKENVYLVDFNIDNMYNMLANSARMQANVEQNPHPNRVLEIMNRNLKFTPLYAETTTGEILNKMKEINADDLMEVYSNFNKNKTISDIIVDDIENIFSPLFMNRHFQEVMGNIDIDRDNSISSRPVANTGEETDMSDIVSTVKGVGKEGKGMTEFINRQTNNENKEDVKIAREKFKSIVKQLLCFNICLPAPYTSVDDILKDGKGIEGDLKKFRIDNLGVLEAVYNGMNPTWQQRLNDMLLKTSLLAQNMQNKDEDKFYDNMQKLGRFGKNEVPTPEPVIRKMIGKLDAKDFENAESILIVNSKYGEFVRVINKEFGSDIARKCRVVCSSEMAEVITKKMFSTLKKTKGSFYDNNIKENQDFLYTSHYNEKLNENQAEPFDFSDMILNIGDVNGDGKYDINDFLEMKNEDILKMNGGKKFDICMMNPPYGSRKSGDENLHFKFVEKCLEIADKQVSIFPDRIITSSNKKYNNYKKLFDNRLENIEQVSAHDVFDISVGSVGIFKFNNESTDKITITDIKGNKEILNSLFDKSSFNQYEKTFIKYLENDHIEKFRKHYQNPGKQEKKDKQLLYNLCDKLPDNKVYLTTNLANGGMNGLFISKNTGNIFSSKEDLAEQWYNNGGRGFCCLIMNNIKSAENCKIALQNPVLRFTLYRLQDDQNMHKRVYKYVPDINWEDDRVRTDEGLLEVCGCPKDKCKEYADYCKKIMDEVDKK